MVRATWRTNTLETRFVMASKLMLLQRDRAAVSAKISAVLDGITPAEFADGKPKKKEHDKLAAELAAIDADILAEQVRRDRITGSPAGMSEEDLLGADRQRAEGGTAAIDRRLAQLQASGPLAGRHYGELFGEPTSAAASGWKGLNDYLATIHTGRSDERLVQAASMGTYVGSDGGFLVPEQYSAELLDLSLEDEIVRPRARVYPMTTEVRKIAGWDSSDHTNGTIAGLVGRWMGESATNTTQKAKTRLLELHAHKLAIYAQASNELVADGMSFEEQLGQAMRAAIGFKLDQGFISGNGVAKPLGYLNDPALVTVSKESGQAADTILYENLVAMFARMYPAGLSKSVWVANQTAIPQLLTLTLPVGTGGAAIPVMTESGGKFSILTRPVIFTEKVPTLGDLGDVSLVDFSQYAIGIRKELVLDKSNGPGWFEDETSYRAILRVDGRGTWDEPLVPANGAATLSWAVTLQARA